eukprot:1680958-Ditylum_brightwellii.AAC.1
MMVVPNHSTNADSELSHHDVDLNSTSEVENTTMYTSTNTMHSDWKFDEEEALASVSKLSVDKSMMSAITDCDYGTI